MQLFARQYNRKVDGVRFSDPPPFIPFRNKHLYEVREQIMFPNELPWYKSKIIIGAIISILTKILVATGLVDGAIDDAALTEAILLLVGGGADLWIMFSRVTQKAAPTITGS